MIELLFGFISAFLITGLVTWFLIMLRAPLIQRFFGWLWFVWALLIVKGHMGDANIEVPYWPVQNSLFETLENPFFFIWDIGGMLLASWLLTLWYMLVIRRDN